MRKSTESVAGPLALLGLSLLWFLTIGGIWVGIIWALIHFIRKFW